MKKFLSLAALAVLPVLGVLFAAPAFADSPGQLSNGANNYKVRNVTTNGAYAQSATVACNETVKYSVTLSNSDFGLLKDLTVKANLASGAITASAINAESKSTSVSGNVNVAVAKGTLSYIPGSTVRITSDGKTTSPLSDGVIGAGVNAGNLNGSTAIFVQFQAKVNCPTTPEVPETPETPQTPETPVTPTELPQTGATGIVGVVAALLTAGVAYAVTTRKNLLG